MSKPLSVDELAAASAADPEDLSLKAELWNAVIGLPVWWMVPRQQGEAVSPMVLQVQNKPMVAVFSTGERCRAFAQRKGIDFVDAAQGLAIPPAKILQFLDDWKQAGAWGMVFDPLEHALTAPFESLQAMLLIAESN